MGKRICKQSITNGELSRPDIFDIEKRLNAFAEFFDVEWEDDFGYLSLGFDDSQGYVACDGDEKWEAECSINYDGIHWAK